MAMFLILGAVLVVVAIFLVSALTLRSIRKPEPISLSN